ncbi:helix-turn-helix domain-containing protein [Lutibacter sp. TH_r2]|uniref:helix-turn-helix domain-containing protein n=1 Tax=Lutibacter sp. TH_r2 TaxID=3082083 RepID=UPI002953942A|nr:helix-turn-helix domain-containing protein [Lutibacter sp. TH_r2]MDV7187155.1 helix-turn-helix domain-containing protein [Lutibacter sp. TH_r2]
MTIGEKIKTIRIQKGLTQETLAEKTTISTRTIQRIENNEVDPRSYTLEQIAEALEIDFNEFTSFQFQNNEKVDNQYLALVHLSGLLYFIFPPILLWMYKKGQVKNLDKHAKDVVNYQISVVIYLLVCIPLMLIVIGFFAMIFIATFSFVVIIMNSIKVLNGQDYKYKYSLKILK